MSTTNIDPTTYEVIRHRTWQITEEMGIALKHVSVSPVVTDVNDFSTGVHLVDGSSAAMGAGVQVHFGSAPTLVRNVIADCSVDPGIEEGDMFITNDPWKGALHGADVCVVAPLHWKGKLVGFTQCTAHQVEIGAIFPGGFAVTQDAYQEGVRLPPTKIVARGEVRNDLIRLIMNMIRLPQVLLDFKGLIAANNVARTRIYELFNRYGMETTIGVWAENIKQSRERFKARLRELPDGTFSHVDRIEFDGVTEGNYEVRLKMTKKDDDLIFDFTGTSQQTGAGINTTFPGTLAGVISAVQPSLCPDIPWNEGILGSLTVIAPLGTLCNATLPAPTSRGSVGTVWLVRNCSQACVGRLMATSPKYSSEAGAVWMGGQTHLQISGQNQYGDRFIHIFLDTMAGGCGATASRDGMDCAGDTFVVTMMIPNVESHEATNPVLILYRRRLPDSGGAGKFRGGISMEMATTPYGVDSIFASMFTHGVEMPNAAGIFGGYPGCQCGFRLKRKTDFEELVSRGKIPGSIDAIRGDEEKVAPCVPFIQLNKGDVIRWHWSGGGGYGDPLDRDPRLVETDVFDGVVTRQSAREIYGVVFAEPEGRVDTKATDALRVKIRNSRLGRS